MYAAHSSTGRPERLPDLFGLETVAHQVAGFDGELLALVAFGLRELRVVVAQREAAERDVARLVLHHVRVDRRGQRVLRLIADLRERRERQALDQHLHAEVRHVPARVAEDVVEQALQRRRDRVGELELVVQQPRVRLDVARLVDHLRRGVELGVDARHLLHDLRGADQRALLAVQELRQLPGLKVAAEIRLLLARQSLADVGAEDRDRLVGQLLGILRIEVLRPVDARRRRPTAAPCPSGRASAATSRPSSYSQRKLVSKVPGTGQSAPSTGSGICPSLPCRASFGTHAPSYCVVELRATRFSTRKSRDFCAGRGVRPGW